MYSANPATCNTQGNVDYWQCRICQTYTIFDNGVQKSVLPERVFIPAQHALTKVEAKDTTCTADGNIEYYRCTRNGCGKLLSDTDGKTETTLSAVTLPTQHVLTLVPRKEPTYEQNGNIEYYCCTREGCGKLFADAEGKQELTPDDVVLPMLVRTDHLPQTGDTSRPAAWLALLGASCAGLWCLSRRRG